MAYLNANTQNVVANPILRVIADAFADYKAAAARRAVYREVIMQLEEMTDRDLADIGISRGEIRDVATKAAYANA